MVECKTYRYRGHWEGDTEVYRTKDEVEKWKAKDPLVRHKRYLLENRIADSDEFRKIEEAVENELEKAIEYAENSPVPELHVALEDVFA